MPTLQHIALVRIAVALWNEGDVKDLASKFYFSSPMLNVGERKSEWLKVEDEVIKKISKLPLPELLKKELTRFVGAVGWQILTWKEYHTNLLGILYAKKNLNKLHWTPQGTVDKNKTAELLVNDESSGINERYKLACTYCLEDHIHVLWRQMLKDLYKEDIAYIRIHEPPLVSFWSYYLEGEIDQLDNIMKEYCRDDNVTHYEYAFQRSALSGNEAATRYFMKKITPEEKEKILVRTAVYVANMHSCFVGERTDFPKEYYTDVLCFLLLQMGEEQQLEVFKSYPYRVLKCFLDWPWHSFFMETAEHMWDFLSEEDYYCLLCDIINDKVIKEHKYFNYQKLFEEFFQQIPSSHKTYIINRCISRGSLLSYLFKVGDEENIKLIFRDATAAEKEKIIFCTGGKYICLNLIYDGKWDLLKFLIRNCISSKDVIIKFKEEFKEEFKELIVRRRSKKTLENEKDKWNKFLQLLKDDEKSVEGDSSPPAKIRCLTSEKLRDSKEIFEE